MFKLQLSGGICSGKTTVSQYIINKIGNTVQVSFSEPMVQIAEWWQMFSRYYTHPALTDDLSYPNYKLRDLLLDIYDDYHITLTVEEYFIRFLKHNYTKADWNFKDEVHRKLLQEIGDVLRKHKDTCVIEHLIKRSNRHMNNSHHVICDDVRYRKEVESLSADKFLSVRLEVSPEVQIKRIKATYPNFNFERLKHQTEVDLNGYKNFDYIINADKPIQDVFAEMDAILSKKH